ncbi:MAG: rRNA maturation RNase YbeY [Patescibacteria group bacterium]
MANRITVVGLVRQPANGKLEKDIKRIALAILKILDKDNVAADIYLADNALMRRLNKEYRGKDKVANVLSFVEPINFPHPETKTRFLGEIYLNASCFMLQDSILLIHALLHLFGYTHKRKSDRMKMEKKENYVHHLFRHRNFEN